MNGNRAIAKILRAEGVDWAAAFPEQPLIDELVEEGIRPIICRHERTGVNMADGYSRTLNQSRFGVFTMQTGPGAENALGGVAQAFADSIPILLLPGGQSRQRTQVHPHFESVENYRLITKWAAEINLVTRVPELMRRAFTLLKNGRPGPVLLEILRDVGLEEFPGELEYTPVARLRSAAAAEDVRDLVAALAKAERPMIVAGHGVLWAEASGELARFAELAAVPVMTTLAGKSGFPEDHPLSLGCYGSSGTDMAGRFLTNADFILGVGTSFTPANLNAAIPEGPVLAQITNCLEDVNKYHAVSYGAVGDARLVLRQAIEEAKRQYGEQGRDSSGVAGEIARIQAGFMAEWKPRLTSSEVPISPYRVFTEIASAVDVADTIITHDSGFPRDQLAPFWQSTTPRSYMGWGKSTQLGYGLGLALGAKMAAPDKQVVNVMGDAAFGMAGLDIETAARAEIPILTVVLNNGVMTHYHEHMPLATERWGSNRLGGDYAGVGAALGAYAERVDDPDEVGAALRRGIAANREDRPAVIEVMTKEEEEIPKSLPASG